MREGKSCLGTCLEDNSFFSASLAGNDWTRSRMRVLEVYMTSTRAPIEYANKLELNWLDQITAQINKLYTLTLQSPV